MAKDRGYHYYALNKPYGFLSQFTQEVVGQKTLKDLVEDIPSDVYPVGRLDKDSEGLLLLTNDKSIVEKLLNPIHRHHRKYWAQVDNEISNEALDTIRGGVSIKVNKKVYHTLPAKIIKMDAPTDIWDRHPPIRFRKNIPNSWVEIDLIEGKNRQVRKMLASVGFPVLRLIRIQIEDLKLDLKPGEIRSFPRQEFYRLLKLRQ